MSKAAPRTLLTTALVLASIALPTSKAVASTIFAPTGSTASVSAERIAQSRSATRTVSWHQLELSGGGSALAWVFAVPKGGWVEAADAGWLSALDRATAPEIAPARAAGCDPPTVRQHTWDAVAPIDARSVMTVSMVMGGADAVAALTSAGFAVDDASSKVLATLPTPKDDGDEGVVIVRLAAGASLRTPVLRVLGPPTRALPAWPPSGAPLRSFVLAAGRPTFDTLAELQPTWSSLAWASGSSNYASLLDAARITVSPGFALTMTSRDGVFGDQPDGAAGLTIASLTRRYFGALSLDEGGDPTTSASGWTCARRAIGLSFAVSTVAQSCPVAPTFTVAMPAPSCAVSPPDAISVDAFRCSTRDDLAVALGGMRPADAWLTRHEALANAWPTQPSLHVATGDSLPSFHEAAASHDDGCPSPTAAPDAGTPPASGGTPPTPRGGGGGPALDGGSNGSGNDTANTVAAAADGCGAVADSCASSGADSCSSSSSTDSCGSGASSTDSCSGGGADSCNCGDSSCATARRRRLRASPPAYLALLIAAITRRTARERRERKLRELSARAIEPAADGAAPDGADTCDRSPRGEPPC